ncbi:AraC family transcriptional regulator [Bradyrhizobium sp. UFLA 03-164]|uniref:AraC family transcriptional regulator n=2 Tax=Bradyrhizobium uaiense TaxID=2594946 RepID=A0A6P1BQW1_9BRAD|nr:AraC family transcriptional regulator [Bradyrhizobium uaiense]
MGTDLSCLPRPAEDVFAGCETLPFARLDAGAGLELRCLGGRMELPPAAAMLVEALPPVTVIPADTAATGRIGWLLDRLEEESRAGAPGGAAMTAQIMQMVFIEVLRALPDRESRGWLSALSDPRIGPAITAIHRMPGRDWRLEDLAAISHLSRSQFAARFRAAVGRAPIDYLLHWRMVLARRALAQPGATIAAVAAELGYASESAFGVAFRRVTGTTPRRATRAIA